MATIGRHVAKLSGYAPALPTMATIGRHIAMLSGYAPALPTPFADDGNIDVAAFDEIPDRAGLPRWSSVGRPAKHPRYGPQNMARLFKSRSLLPAAGCRSSRAPMNSTAHAIELTKDAEAAGADAILSVVPYYNKPTQIGLYVPFAPSPSRPDYQSSSMTCRREQPAASPMKQLPGWPSCQTSSVSRTPPAMLRGRRG